MTPNIQKVLGVSFLHLSKSTRALLDAPDIWPSANLVDPALGLRKGYGSIEESHRWLGTGGPHVFCVPFEHGWFVYAHDDELDLPAGMESSYPPDLLALFRLARHYGCDWLKVDFEVPDAYPIQYPADVCGVRLYDEAGDPCFT
jgi:hypothetical protein